MKPWNKWNSNSSSNSGTLTTESSRTRNILKHPSGWCQSSANYKNLKNRCPFRWYWMFTIRPIKSTVRFFRTRILSFSSMVIMGWACMTARAKSSIRGPWIFLLISRLSKLSHLPSTWQKIQSNRSKTLQRASWFLAIFSRKLFLKSSLSMNLVYPNCIPRQTTINKTLLLTKIWAQSLVMCIQELMKIVLTTIKYLNFTTLTSSRYPNFRMISTRKRNMDLRRR